MGRFCFPTYFHSDATSTNKEAKQKQKRTKQKKMQEMKRVVIGSGVYFSSFETTEWRDGRERRYEVRVA